MSSVSSRFSVVNIKDGVTVSGTLRNTNGALSQAYDGAGTFIPNWGSGTASAKESTNPKLWPDMYRDGVRIDSLSLSEYYWEYNGTTIQFDSQTGISTNGALAGKFKESTYNAGGGAIVPALIIWDNLASSANTDNDVIAFRGKVLLSSSSMSFSMSRPVRFTELKGTGYTGRLEFTGSTVIDAEHPTVQLTARMYGGTSGGTTEGFDALWSFGGKELVKTGNPITISADDVDDKLYVRCDFANPADHSEVYCTAIETVDDVTDDYEIYFSTKVDSGQESGADSLSSYAELRAGQQVTLFAWAADANSPQSVRDGWTFKCKLYKTDGTEYTQAISGWHARGSDGYYDQTTNAVDGCAVASGHNHFSAPVSFDLVELCGGQLDGILLATI